MKRMALLWNFDYIFLKTSMKYFKCQNQCFRTFPFNKQCQVHKKQTYFQNTYILCLKWIFSLVIYFTVTSRQWSFHVYVLSLITMIHKRIAVIKPWGEKRSSKGCFKLGSAETQCFSEKWCNHELLSYASEIRNCEYIFNKYDTSKVFLTKIVKITLIVQCYCMPALSVKVSFNLNQSQIRGHSSK